MELSVNSTCSLWSARMMDGMLYMRRSARLTRERRGRAYPCTFHEKTCHLRLWISVVQSPWSKAQREYVQVTLTSQWPSRSLRARRLQHSRITKMGTVPIADFLLTQIDKNRIHTFVAWLELENHNLVWGLENHTVLPRSIRSPRSGATARTWRVA